MKCGSCGFRNTEENKFCIMCGSPLEGGAEGADPMQILENIPGLQDPSSSDIDFLRAC